MARSPAPPPKKPPPPPPTPTYLTDNQGRILTVDGGVQLVVK